MPKEAMKNTLRRQKIHNYLKNTQLSIKQLFFFSQPYLMPLLGKSFLAYVNKRLSSQCKCVRGLYISI